MSNGTRFAPVPDAAVRVLLNPGTHADKWLATADALLALVGAVERLAEEVRR